MAGEDFYKVLGVARTASADDIKRAYRKLARKYHPDVHKGAGTAEKFQAVGNAYDVLRDPEKRAAYDAYGADWENPPRPAQEGQNWDGGFGFAREDMSRADAGVFRDFFDAFGSRGGFSRPSPQQARLALDLEDVFAGARKIVGLRMPEMDPQGRMHWRDHKVVVNVPKGIGEGQHLRLKGQGAEGADLILEIALNPHPIFRVDGRDISVDLPITPWEAALGARIAMPTPGGKVQVKVPPNARSGQRLRLKGRGMPGAVPGDLYASLLIVNPPVKTAKAREFYERMAEELKFDPRKDQGA